MNVERLNRLALLMESLPESEYNQFDMSSYSTCALGYALKDEWFQDQGLNPLMFTGILGHPLHQVTTFFGLTYVQTAGLFYGLTGTPLDVAGDIYDLIDGHNDQDSESLLIAS